MKRVPRHRQQRDQEAERGDDPPRVDE